MKICAANGCFRVKDVPNLILAFLCFKAGVIGCQGISFHLFLNICFNYLLPWNVLEINIWELGNTGVSNALCHFLWHQRALFNLDTVRPTGLSQQLMFCWYQFCWRVSFAPDVVTTQSLTCKLKKKTLQNKVKPNKTAGLSDDSTSQPRSVTYLAAEGNTGWGNRFKFLLKLGGRRKNGQNKDRSQDIVMEMRETSGNKALLAQAAFLPNSLRQATAWTLVSAGGWTSTL